MHPALRVIRMRAIAALLLSLSVLPCTSIAQSVDRYRLLDTDELGFYYSAGLSGFQMNARLAGWFEVTHPIEGDSWVSAFEVSIAEAESDGPFHEHLVGRPVADFLWHDPIGRIVGESAGRLPFNACTPEDWSQDGIPTLSLYPPTGGTFDEIARTNFWIESAGGGLGRLQLRSDGRGLILDGLSATTAGAGLPVMLVPEPSTAIACTVAFVSLAALASRSRLTRRAVEAQRLRDRH